MKRICSSVVAVLLCGTLGIAQATVVYVDAGTSNVTRWDGAAFAPTTGGSGGPTDDNWHLRTGYANGSNVLTTNENGSEDGPMLVLTLSGLTPGTAYQVNGYFWSGAAAHNWRFKGTLSNTLTPSDNTTPWPTIGTDGNNDNILDNASPANLTDDMIDNHPEVSFSRNGSDTSLAGTNLSGLDTTADGFSDSYFTDPTLVSEGDRSLFEAGLGQITANGAGQILVYIDDLKGQSTGGNRTWFDGVGHETVVIPEPGAGLLALLGVGFLALQRRRK